MRFSYTFLLCIMMSIGCKYGFKGISIDPNAKTYAVEIFKVTAPQAPALLGQTFAEELIDKIRRETPLQVTNETADYEIDGSVATYRVDAVAPQAGSTTALNRLNVTISIDFTDNIDEKKSWKQNFSYFYDFDSSENLLDIQDTAIESINEQLLEDIFRRAFTNW